jgi:hypothetical protein
MRAAGPLLIAIALVAAATLAPEGCVTKPSPLEAPPLEAPPVPTPAYAPPSTPPSPVALSAPPADSAGHSTGAAGSAVPPGHAQTPEERRAALDKRLNDSLGSFDAQLRREQQKIALERDARQTAVATSSATDEQSPRKRGDAPKRTARAGDLKSDKSSGGEAGAANGNGAVAGEVPDGSDDDIVARRLRKAAEQETDPELRDKLWKEYADYKNNAQGK